VTRVVVIGPYPPSGDPRADIALREVREQRAGGHDVIVVSPDPSAARMCARPESIWGATRIARVLAGADIVVWFGVDPRQDRDRAPWRWWPHRRLSRALDGVRDVRFMSSERGDNPRAGGAGNANAFLDLRRLRAGAPTYLRTVLAGRRRRRRAPASPNVPDRAQDGQEPR
jgi:hypothetical protein